MKTERTLFKNQSEKIYKKPFNFFKECFKTQTASEEFPGGNLKSEAQPINNYKEYFFEHFEK